VYPLCVVFPVFSEDAVRFKFEVNYARTGLFVVILLCSENSDSNLNLNLKINQQNIPEHPKIV
jgi:hypothetical protein